MKFAGISRAALVAGLVAWPFAGAAMAQTAPAGDDAETVFILGRIENGISNSGGKDIASSSINEEDMRTFDRASVDEAAIQKERKIVLEMTAESMKGKPQQVIETLYKVTKGEAFVASDVGQHQMFAAQYYKFDRPKQWINSGGLGTMGFGLPAAMGAQLANPDATVACITGEASIQMNIQELSTCKQYHVPVKIVNLNNRYLGMVRQWQQIDYEGRYSHSYMDTLPNFVKLAEAYGHVGIQVTRPEDVEPALREARRLKDRTVFLDILTDPTENVFPMVKAGKGITEMLMSSEDL